MLDGRGLGVKLEVSGFTDTPDVGVRGRLSLLKGGLDPAVEVADENLETPEAGGVDAMANATSTDTVVAVVGAGVAANDVIVDAERQGEDQFLSKMALYCEKMLAEAHKLRAYFENFTTEDQMSEGLLDELEAIIAEFASVEDLIRVHPLSSLIRHSMVSPVRAIDNNMGFLLDDTGVEDRKEDLMVIRRSIEGLMFVLDHVMPTVIEGGFKVNDRDLNRTLDLVLGRMNGHAKDIEVDIPQGLKGRFLAGGLFPVIENFVANAFKYGATKVKVEAVLLGDAAVELRVHDNGPHIPNDLKRDLFKNHIADSKSSGVGLLMTGKMINDLHGLSDVPDHEHFDTDLVQNEANTEAGTVAQKYFYLRMPLGEKEEQA